MRGRLSKSVLVASFLAAIRAAIWSSNNLRLLEISRSSLASAVPSGAPKSSSKRFSARARSSYVRILDIKARQARNLLRHERPRLPREVPDNREDRVGRDNFLLEMPFDIVVRGQPEQFISIAIQSRPGKDAFMRSARSLPLVIGSEGFILCSLRRRFEAQVTEELHWCRARSGGAWPPVSRLKPRRRHWLVVFPSATLVNLLMLHLLQIGAV